MTDTSDADAADAAVDESYLPAPDPALERLDRFVGVWIMEGRTDGAAEANIRGQATFRWLPGGFFLEQRIELDFAGMAQIASLELVGYDPDSDAFPSQVYSNMSPQPLPYTWRVDGDELTISVTYGPMDATFRGRFAPDGRTFSGEWKPNPGADPTINTPYEISGHRAG